MTNLGYDALTEHIESSTTVPDDYDANTENGYSSTPNLYTLSSTSDAETFLTRFTRENGYKDSTTNTTLKLGDQIAIKDGTYNVNWYVAGFDVEHNQTAMDNTLYDNGYGIALIPVAHVTTGKLYYGSPYPKYISNYAYTTLFPEIATHLKDVLSDHLIQRNTLLTNTFTSYPSYSGGDYYGHSTGYIWDTTQYCTLLSGFQTIGISCTTNGTGSTCQITMYDIGEAKYKLPLFDNISCYANEIYPVRGSSMVIYDFGKDNSNDYYYAYVINSSSLSTPAPWTNGGYSTLSNASFNIRPMIYIR